MVNYGAEKPGPRLSRITVAAHVVEAHIVKARSRSLRSGASLRASREHMLNANTANITVAEHQDMWQTDLSSYRSECTKRTRYLKNRGDAINQCVVMMCSKANQENIGTCERYDNLVMCRLVT